MRYATLADLATHLQIPDAVDDAVLEVALRAAEGQIDAWCRRTFDTVDPSEDPAETRTFRLAGTHLDIGDAVDVDTVTIDGSTVDGWHLWPYNSLQDGRPFQTVVFDRAWHATVEVEGWFGWPSTPAEVRQATVLQAARLAQRRNAQFGVAVVPGMDGTGMRLLAKLDADVELLLAPYRSRPVLV
jgi:hypothetical protein